MLGLTAVVADPAAMLGLTAVVTDLALVVALTAVEVAAQRPLMSIVA